MILGVGIDIIEVARIQRSHEKYGGRFLERILLPNEIAYCLSHRSAAPHIAVRFAAKEAISKAFGTGIGRELSWHDMEIGRHESGAPFVVMHGKGNDLFRSRTADKLHITLSHTEQHATAFAILEGNPR